MLYRLTLCRVKADVTYKLRKGDSKHRNNNIILAVGHVNMKTKTFDFEFEARVLIG